MVTVTAKNQSNSGLARFEVAATRRGREGRGEGAFNSPGATNAAVPRSRVGTTSKHDGDVVTVGLAIAPSTRYSLEIESLERLQIIRRRWSKVDGGKVVRLIKLQTEAQDFTGESAGPFLASHLRY
jgi:hypothetical protein